MKCGFLCVLLHAQKILQRREVFAHTEEEEGVTKKSRHLKEISNPISAA